jgi:hypothetical protein
MRNLAPVVLLTAGTAASAAPPARCEVAADIRTGRALPADWADTLGTLLEDAELEPDGACVRVRRQGGGQWMGVLEADGEGFSFFEERVRIHPQDTVVVGFHGSDFNAAR